MSNVFTMETKIKLRKVLSAAFVKADVSTTRSGDIAFHMLDWIEDLEELYFLYVNIDKKNDSEIRDIIEKFLTHAPAHINAARFLDGLGKVEDVFQLGIFEDNGNEDE